MPTTPDRSPAQLRLAVAQTSFRTDPGAAHAFQDAGAEVRRLMRQARAAGADVLQLPEAAKEGLMSQIALGRLGSGDDIAGVVRFLAGPAASYITGQVLVVDGGIT